MRKQLLLLFFLGLFTKSFGQFTEGFETGIPSSWTIINAQEITTWSHISTTTTVNNTDPSWMHSGSGAASISILWGTQDDYLITPAITVVSGENDRISFWAARFAYENTVLDGIEVAISTTTPDAAGMSAIDAIAPEVVNHSPFYKKYTYDLSGYVGQTIYVGFRSTQTQPVRICIDDVVNDALPKVLPGCSTITYPENGATNVDPVGLLKWTEVPEVDGYAVMLGTTPGGAEVYGALDVSDVTSKSIGPLALNTTYYATIIPYNNIGPSVGCTEYSFTTRSEILGDFCHSAIDLSTMPPTFTSTTAGAGDDDFACYLWTGPDVFYTIEVPDGSTFTMKQTHNGYQSANTVFYGQCTDRTEIYCGIATDLYNPVVWQNTTGAPQQVYWIQYGTGWDPEQDAGEYTIEWSLASCDFPTATYQTVSNCDVAPGFFVAVDITSMGSANSLHITDNQGSPMQTATATGAVQFGPYAIGTAVLFNVTNADEATCKITSNPMTLSICPPDCSEATVITLGEPVECVLGTGAGAWDFANGLSSGMEKIYSFTPTVSGLYTVETIWEEENTPINMISLFTKTADANCGSGWDYLGTSDSFGSFISSEGLIAGTEYLLLFDAMETTGSYNKFQILFYEDCDQAVVTHTVTSDCEVGSEYYVEVTIESMGSATSHDFWFYTDEPQFYGEITAPGVINLGPFAYGTQMMYMLTNDDTQLCTSVGSGRVTQLGVCPNFLPTCANLTYPSNAAVDVPLINNESMAGLTITWDAPADSITPTGYSIYIGFTPTTLAYIGYTTTELSMPLIGFTGDTTYYWKIVPWNNFEQFLMATPLDCEVHSFTTAAFVPNGYCLNGPQGITGVFTPLCDGTSEAVAEAAYAGYYEYVNVTEGENYTFSTNGANPSGAPDLITIGSEDGSIALAWSVSPLNWTANVTGPIRFYIHLSELCHGDELVRTKSITCNALATPTFDISALRAYPNPTKDILNLSYLNGIKELSVFNILGQEVMVKTVNNTAFQLDMKSLSSGTYLIKVLSDDNAIKTIKVIKE